MCEYSHDVAQLFQDGLDVVYFSDSSDLLDKVTYYLEHADERERIAQHGRLTVEASSHSVVDRLQTMVSTINELL